MFLFVLQLCEKLMKPKTYITDSKQVFVASMALLELQTTA